MLRHLRNTAALLLLLALSLPTLARVLRVEVVRREDVLGGKAFGAAGAYEKLVGRVYFAVPPGDPHNRQIVDLDQADRNPQGEVEFSADFYVLRPKNPALGNGALLLEISNRGGKGILGIMNGGRGGADPTTEPEFGDAFLMNRGYTVAWVGWQWDVRPDARLLHLYAPIAHGPNGTHIRGLVRSDFTLSEPRAEMPLGHWISNSIGGMGYAVADSAAPENVLTVRDQPLAPRRTLPRADWQFTDDRKSFRLAGGFQPGKIYELVFVAEDPAVAGTGLLAVRDFVTYLKHDAAAIAPVKRAYGAGISQSGRFLRHFLYQDCNADEQGRMVFDGIIPHVAGAGRGSFNHRFAQPSRDAQPLNALFYPTDLFPFTDTVERDPVTGERDGLLVKAERSQTLPKIFLTNTSYEYWARRVAHPHLTRRPPRPRALAQRPHLHVRRPAARQRAVSAGADRGPAAQ